jgi:hypothetical protein
VTTKQLISLSCIPSARKKNNQTNKQLSNGHLPCECIRLNVARDMYITWNLVSFGNNCKKKINKMQLQPISHVKVMIGYNVWVNVQFIQVLIQMHCGYFLNSLQTPWYVVPGNPAQWPYTTSLGYIRLADNTCCFFFFSLLKQKESKIYYSLTPGSAINHGNSI